MADAKLQVSAGEVRGGGESIVISSAAATWVYDVAGGGFASLLDADGRDWISYAPGGGSAGEYRGIPNMVFRGPQSGYFHPGNRGPKSAKTRVVQEDDACISLESTSCNRMWMLRWDLYGAWARLHVLKVDPDDADFWFLYEGTPGGGFDPDRSRWLTSTGESGALETPVELEPSMPFWIGFTDAEGERTLVLCREQGEPTPVSYRRMDPMTVFGFGRRVKGLERHMSRAGETFLVGLVDTCGPDEIGKRVGEWMGQ